jgi:hypothetical protein
MNVFALQRDLNAFFKKFKLGYSPLRVDGENGAKTKERVRDAKVYLGYKGETNSVANGQFRWRLEHPWRTSKKYRVSARDVKRGVQRRVNRRKALRARQWDWAWGGSRGVTDEVVRIVGERAPITSRKRTATFGNPGSDHHVSQVSADAVDFGIANAHWLKNEISRRLGGPSTLADFGNFFITRKGRRYRVQIIAGTHGTGPHLHVGVRRA